MRGEKRLQRFGHSRHKLTFYKLSVNIYEPTLHPAFLKYNSLLTRPHAFFQRENLMASLKYRSPILLETLIAYTHDKSLFAMRFTLMGSTFSFSPRYVVLKCFKMDNSLRKKIKFHFLNNTTERRFF